LISRNEKNKKNNIIHCNGNKVEEEKLDNGFKVEEEKLDNGKKENEKRLIINQILCVFLIAFAIWKIISM
jgi:cytochrome oxidase Cu insertion factor (SCO1/SenC/PrrC family)